ncbi:sirq protein [Colletotrichum karsti]|uniref:Sirq protein n=1 Tax=Colletotrichum karsti TaxID=1095194 RepID=A0A9P6HW57_9PEZI|nr:sirq protein [Colletotrichum karsti]KAF9869376.1 sirq protein [Colletotrichum karsti]
MSERHALIYGASGITGWSITNAILGGYPTESTFTSVTALTNRPLAKEAAQWPRTETPQLHVASGIDILTSRGQEGLEADLRDKVKNISQISHVYFFAYIMDTDPAKECRINKELLRRAISAVENLSSSLEFVVLPTGTKAYGVHLLDQFPFSQDLPLRESLPRIPEPFASQMFYYDQTDMLSQMAKGKNWSWCEIIPDNIIGFVPNNNIYCLAQTIGTYLSLYAELHEKGAECPFPGTEKSWNNLSSECNQDIIAKVCIYASLHPEQTSEQRYNVADNSQPSSWSRKWPVICEYFGLEGTGPPAQGQAPQPVQYLSEHFDEWKELEKKHGLVTGRVANNRSFEGFAGFIMSMLNFDRHLDVSKCHEMWGPKKEEIDTRQSWYTTLDRFKEARIIH